MKKLNITKKRFNESKYFQNKYGKLEFVSESGKVYKTDKGQLIKFVNENLNTDSGLNEKEFLRKVNEYKRILNAINKVYDIVDNLEDAPEDTLQSNTWRTIDKIRTSAENAIAEIRRKYLFDLYMDGQKFYTDDEGELLRNDDVSPEIQDAMDWLDANK